MFLWTDIETTGLDPATDRILSVGMILTDDHFVEVARREWDVWAPPGLDMSAWAKEQHTKSGLLARCACADPGWMVLCSILGWVDGLVGPPAQDIKQRPIMAGSSIHFDRSFLMRQMPAVLARVHYRMLDVSTLKVLCMATVPGALEWEAAQGDAAHTCLADLEASMGELAHWRQVLRTAP